VAMLAVSINLFCLGSCGVGAAFRTAQ
jgi:hypothetical protein